MGVTEPGGQSREDRSRELLRQVWLRNRPTTMERLSVVQSALEAMAAGNLDAGPRLAARDEAHKLRGILGTYGFAEGSELAAEAEELLEGDGAGAGGLAARLAGYAGTLPTE
ncbi:MAG TPA: Hpt domain-containing protein [Acidimicrobiales bacterium]|nr:Hpt domain-containing protein [Acidimicrobiales bacterium]